MVAKKNMTSLLVGFTVLFFLSKYVLSIQPSSSEPASQPKVRTNMALFIYVFSGHHQTPFCFVTHNFVFRQESGSYTACFIPTFVALLQIIITSCKAICFETLCWWPPMFDWGPGLTADDEFSKPPLLGGMKELPLPHPLSLSPPPPYYPTSRLPVHVGPCIFDYCLYLYFFTFLYESGVLCTDQKKEEMPIPSELWVSM